MKFLLNVGAEKSGTTWLYNYFYNHPQFHHIGKELNIIQRNDIVPTHSNYPQYKSNIENFFSDVSKLNKVTGDFTHYEGSTENVYRLIKDGLLKYDIEVVPVYIMRDPIDRAWSAWHELHQAAVYHGLQHNDITDFNMPGPAAFTVHSMLQCKYKETVKALDAVFSKPLYFFYETFFTQSNINIICDRLDISRIQANFTPFNKGLYTTSPSEHFIRTFGTTPKNVEAVRFIHERFDNVPWRLSDYS